MPIAVYKGARLRVATVILISVAAVGIAAFLPWLGAANWVFVLMAVVNPISRCAERRWLDEERGASLPS